LRWKRDFEKGKDSKLDQNIKTQRVGGRFWGNLNLTKAWCQREKGKTSPHKKSSKGRGRRSHATTNKQRRNAKKKYSSRRKKDEMG